jgi:exodeoxyribonuclease V beta subunit
LVLKSTTKMQRYHYPLQALFYLVALHRYLRWRLQGYRPEEHLGGVLYLFLRGMVGPDTPLVEGQPCGVFAWQVPAPLVLQLSALLETGELEGPEGFEGFEGFEGGAPPR